MNAPFSPTTVDTIRAQYAAKACELMIANRFQPAQSGETLDVFDPATGQKLATIAAGGAADVDLAVKAARKAFPAWRATPPAQRARLMLKLADLIEADGEAIAITESLDNGMPFMMAKFGGVMGGAEQLRYNAGWATKITGETITPSAPGEWHAYTVREPVGVVGAIVPWNFPFVMAVAKIAPALAAGCTVVLKPAEQSPLTAVRLAELIVRAGFPEGVVNVVTGLGETAGAALVDHPDVDKISFTGSTSVGKLIVQNCAKTLKRVTLELGGKSPVIVFDDADVEKAIPGVAMGIFGNSGQICAAGSRLFVHERVYDKLVEGVAGFAQSLRIGPGLSPDTQMGPVVSEEQAARVLSYIESGKVDGATMLTGGARMDRDGYFIQPTIFAGTKHGMKIVDEEIFGPVLCAMKFGDDDDLETLAGLANATTYGLSSVIWTRDINKALKMAARIRAGSVRINGGGGVDAALPLGGMKQSGWGRENGRVGVETYTELKTVSVSLG